MDTPLLSFVVLKTRNIEACLNFYRHLGMVFTEERHGRGPLHYSTLLNGVLLEIYPEAAQIPEIESGAQSVMLGIEVNSLSKVLEGLVQLSAKVVHPEKEGPSGRQAVVKDPDGRLIRMHEKANS